MKNLSFTDFMKEMEQQKAAAEAAETEVAKTAETFTDFCYQQKISLAEAEQKQMELLEEKKQQYETKVKDYQQKVLKNVLNYLKGSIDLENLTNILEGEILDEIQ